MDLTHISSNISKILSIQKYGNKSYSLKKIASTSLVDSDDPTKGAVETSTTYILNSFPSQYKAYQVDGELIKIDDTKLIVDSSNLNTGSITITEDDIITHTNGTEYKILNIRPTYVNDTIILYVLQLRK